MNDEKNIFDSLQDEIYNSDLSENEKNRRLSMLRKANSKRVNILLVGVSGCGKSSTINALFNMNVAKVGVGVDPETKEIAEYKLDNLTIWDSPGLGDGIESDKKYAKQIAEKLSETDNDGNLLIDLVLVVLDASSKDLAVSYNIINDTLIPCLGQDNAHRILIALNQSDMAMKGRHWNHDKNEPEPKLQAFLTQKVASVKRRIENATDITVEPVYYSAGYTEENGEKQNPYNLSKLLLYILMAVPAEKRLILADKLNTAESNWIDNDDDMDYPTVIKDTFFDSLLYGISNGAEKGGFIGGCVLGFPGMISGGLVGGIIGGLHALIIRPLIKL